jgi:hypothetical protein
MPENLSRQDYNLVKRPQHCSARTCAPISRGLVERLPDGADLPQYARGWYMPCLSGPHRSTAVHSGLAQDADDAVGVEASHPTEEET